MSRAKDDESISEFIFYFILGALLFFAIPIRIPAPETHYLTEFQNFTLSFNRTYHENTSEYQRRYQIYKKTLETIEDLRQQGNSSVFGINGFSDLSTDEFIQRYLIAERSHNTSESKSQLSLTSLFRYKLKNFGQGPSPLPQSVDWRKRGIITRIRNQGVCGSCYIQSVIANVESMHALKWNFSKAHELSVQQMMDCSDGKSNSGCQGGDTYHLLRWLKKSQITILPQRVYKVFGRKSACGRNVTAFSSTSQTVRVMDFTCSSFIGQEYEMLAFLAFKGPLIASVDALPWKNYVGGVIKENCNGPANHAVQIVGYDLSGNVDLPHFIVRNSWGTSFGYRGYAKIAIGRNVCGIAEEVSSVTVD